MARTFTDPNQARRRVLKRARGLHKHDPSVMSSWSAALRNARDAGRGTTQPKWSDEPLDFTF